MPGQQSTASSQEKNFNLDREMEEWQVKPSSGSAQPRGPMFVALACVAVFVFYSRMATPAASTVTPAPPAATPAPVVQAKAPSSLLAIQTGQAVAQHAQHAQQQGQHHAAAAAAHHEQHHAQQHQAHHAQQQHQAHHAQQQHQGAHQVAHGAHHMGAPMHGPMHGQMHGPVVWEQAEFGMPQHGGRFLQRRDMMQQHHFGAPWGGFQHHGPMHMGFPAQWHRVGGAQNPTVVENNVLNSEAAMERAEKSIIARETSLLNTHEHIVNAMEKDMEHGQVNPRREGAMLMQDANLLRSENNMGHAFGRVAQQEDAKDQQAEDFLEKATPQERDRHMHVTKDLGQLRDQWEKLEVRRDQLIQKEASLKPKVQATLQKMKKEEMAHKHH